MSNFKNSTDDMSPIVQRLLENHQYKFKFLEEKEKEEDECEECGECPCECSPKRPKGGDGGKPGPDKNYVKPMGESVRVPAQNGNVYLVAFTWRGKYMMMKMFFPELKRPSRKEVEASLQKVYPGSRVQRFDISAIDSNDPYINAGKLNEEAKVEPPKERLKTDRDMFNISKDEKEAARQRLLAKAKAKREKMKEETEIDEGNLHNWFSKSKSKDGKPGWVQSDGSPCANEPGETKTPKCYSSRRLAGLKKTKEGQAKIKSADARKSREDSGQQQKSGGAKPTMVRTFKDPKDYKKHPSGDYQKEGYEVTEAADKKGSGSGKKDACYHKVKSRFKVWPSAYASGALVKCRKAGADNWGNSTKKEEVEFDEQMTGHGKRLDTYYHYDMEDAGVKPSDIKNRIKKGKSIKNTIKKEEVEFDESAAWTRKEGKNKAGGLNEKGRKSYEAENPGSDLKAPSKKVGNPRRASFCARMSGMKKKLTSAKTANDPDSRINKSLRAWNC